MNYIRLPNGNKKEIYDRFLSNGFIVKFIDENPKDIIDFFGKEVINYVDIVDENDNLVENIDLYMKYKQMNISEQEITEKEQRLVQAEYTEEKVDEESGDKIIIPHPAVYETIEKYKTVSMITVILEKPSTEEEIDNIKEVVGIKNVANMSIDEFKKYHKEEIGKLCTAAIENGVDVETSKGLEHFSYTIEDQSNIKDLIIIRLIVDFIKMQYGDKLTELLSTIGEDFEITFPYHSDKNLCDIYTADDILKIYMALSSNKTYHTTYCNLLNSMISESADMTTIKSITYGMDITDEKYLSVIDKVNKSKDTLLKLVELVLSKENTKDNNESESGSENDSKDTDGNKEIDESEDNSENKDNVNDTENVEKDENSTAKTDEIDTKDETDASIK